MVETMTLSPAADRDDILLQLKDIRDLPTLPAVFVRIIKALRNPNASVKEIAGVVETDQAITMKILRLINSSFYGLSRSVDSVHQAIVLLGANTLKNVVISASVFKALGSGEKNPIFDREAFWQHSIGCGMIARYLGNRTGLGREEEGFIAGIIHDIGKVVLDQYFHDNLTQVVQQVATRKISFYQAETETMGLSHAEIGAYLAETWSLPEKLVEVIAMHHQPNATTQYGPLVALVCISDVIARQYGVGSGGDALVPQLDSRVWQKIGLKPADLQGWDKDIRAEIEKGKELLKVMMN
jgi:putative nucleotidyltransferase with HDIG domain